MRSTGLSPPRAQAKSADCLITRPFADAGNWFSTKLIIWLSNDPCRFWIHISALLLVSLFLPVHPSHPYAFRTMNQVAVNIDWNSWQYKAIENMKFIQSSNETRVAALRACFMGLPPSLPYNADTVSVIHKTDQKCANFVGVA